MATLPTLTRNWEFAFNQTPITTNTALVLFTLKQNLIGLGPTAFTTPWVVDHSCDGVTAGTPGDAVDRWLNSGDVVHHNPGSLHSWIVLQNDAISPGFQILIEAIRNSGGGQDSWDCRFSEGVGFTGGTNMLRPTAADEIDPVEGSAIMLVVNSNNLAVEPANLNVMMSDDGKHTRWFIFSAGTNVHFVDIQVPKNTLSGWTIPWVATFAVQYYNSGADTPQCTYAKLWTDNPPGRVYSRAGGLESVLYYTQEAALNASTFLGIVQTFQNDLAPGGYPMFPIGLYSETVGSRGRIGELVDMWGSSTFPGTGDHYPADTSRQFVQIDDLVIPYDGGAQLVLN